MLFNVQKSNLKTASVSLYRVNLKKNIIMKKKTIEPVAFRARISSTKNTHEFGMIIKNIVTFYAFFCSSISKNQPAKTHAYAQAKQSTKG